MEVVLTLLLMFVILVGGPISGGSMNPARSLGPALLTWTWSGQWVYLVGPLSGAAAGALGYRWLVGRNGS